MKTAIVYDRMHSFAKEGPSPSMPSTFEQSLITGDSRVRLDGWLIALCIMRKIMFLKEAKTMKDNTKSFVLSWEKFREDEPDRSLEWHVPATHFRGGL
jgi:hypothetical protein